MICRFVGGDLTLPSDPGLGAFCTLILGKISANRIGAAEALSEIDFTDLWLSGSRRGLSPRAGQGPLTYPGPSAIS